MVRNNVIYAQVMLKMSKMLKRKPNFGGSYTVNRSRAVGRARDEATEENMLQMA
jgi:hypothetical protein